MQVTRRRRRGRSRTRRTRRGRAGSYEDIRKKREKVTRRKFKGKEETNTTTKSKKRVWWRWKAREREVREQATCEEGKPWGNSQELKDKKVEFDHLSQEVHQVLHTSGGCQV